VENAVWPDLSEAVELAPRVWWVGSMLPDDQFQCHAYLIEQGDESVLVDPGSALAVDDLIRKVDEVVGVERVRWLVCSHSDPDIISALPALAARGMQPNAAIVTHWRDEALIRHSAPPLPYWRVEEHGWHLRLQDRTLQFVFTPYAHSAGAFCTFDPASGTLFSSDLFGGFSNEKTLYASSMDDFDGIRAFHEHYMPSREILNYSLERLRRLRVNLIAPQHGRVIPEHLVLPIMERLGELECGVYLLAHDDPGLEFLLRANRTLREVIGTLVGEARFPVIATRLAEITGEFLHATGLEFWAKDGDTFLHFDAGDGYTGHAGVPEPNIERAFSGATFAAGHDLVVPLRAASTPAHVNGADRSGTDGNGADLEENDVLGVAVLGFDRPPMLDAPTQEILDHIAELVEVSLTREVMRRIADLDRDAFYEQATHDALTGLYNRAYIAEASDRLCAIDDRGDEPRLAALMIDIDHFKVINDTFGHGTGDVVLQQFADAMRRVVRPGDVPVRFGGEEFLVVLAGVDRSAAVGVGERIRSAMTASTEPGSRVTASVGVALRQRGETFDQLVGRADEALYRAKVGGRDRVEVTA
jgi:diguanylate cyclase (GGDEF)-like protein